MSVSEREPVAVWRRSTGEKLPRPLPRGSVRFNPDLSLTPVQRAADRKKNRQQDKEQTTALEEGTA
jgi:hypothetical protein